jgi:hypothetical protein
MTPDVYIQVRRRLRAHTRHGHRETGVEEELQRQYRNDQQPGQARVAAEPHHHDEDHDHREEELLKLLKREGDGQRGPREVQGAHQAQVAGDRPDTGHHRALGEGEHEHAGHQERDVRTVRHAPAGLQDEAEDQVVHARVQQRSGDLPQLAQLGLAVLRGELRLREGEDEVTPSPQPADVLDEPGPGTADREPVLGGQLGRAQPFVE